MYLHTVSLCSINAAEKRELFTALGKGRPQLVVRAVAKHFALGEEHASTAPEAKRSPFLLEESVVASLYVVTGSPDAVILGWPLQPLRKRIDTSAHLKATRLLPPCYGLQTQAGGVL